MKTRIRILAVTLLAVFGLLCAAQTSLADGGKKGDDGNKKMQGVASEAYVLGPEDVITILVQDVPEVSGDYLVRLDGKISFPMIGEVEVAGKTAGELREYLDKALSAQLRDPRVTVNIRQMRLNRIYILGAVQRPYVYDFRPGWRLTELIADAGGLAVPPERCKAIVFRQGQPTQTIELKDVFVYAKDEDNIALQAGDVVNVQPDVTERVNVIGDVHTPGVHDIIDGTGAVEALAASGGQNGDAVLSQCKIVRDGQQIPVNLYDAVVLGRPEKNVEMKDGDTLYVPEQIARVSVVGWVNKPGALLIPDGRPYTLSMAISEAGGPAPTAKLDGVLIQRYGDDGKVTPILVNYKKIGSKAGSEDPVLQDKDVIYVPESGATNVNQLGGLANLYFIVRAIFGQ